MQPDSDRPPWARQRGESGKAHAAFLAYLNLGQTRSLARLGRQLGRSVSLLERWSSRWGWVARCQVHDEAVQERKLQKRLAVIEEMEQRQATEMLLLQQKGLEALQAIDFRTLRPTEILAYIIEAAKQERVLRGQPESIMKQNQADADGNQLPAPAPTIIQEILVTTREEAQAVIAASRAEGIPLLSDT
jgi:hypothetical protein